VTDKAPRAFFERARQEADRYGPDDWVFARELLQNARDAGATRVGFETEERDGKSLLRCRDDGSGMTLEHARRYLFSLYTSSKDGQQRQAGRFGVGFWSVLRFTPNRITIRSRTRLDAGFGICLDLDRNVAVPASPLETVGTEIVLERDGTPNGQLERRTRDAVKQNGRFLRTLDRDTLDILVNGHAVNERFALSAPSVTFEGKGFRGVVGLGTAPRVELFSRGLRVRAAAALDDLLSSSHQTNHTRVVFPEMPGGLAPQAILDSEDIELLLDRSEARDQKSLIRLVKTAERQLARLVERQLTLLHPEPWWQRLRGATGNGLRKGAPVVTLAVVVGAAFMLAQRLTGGGNTPPFRSTNVTASAISGTAPTREFAYRDLARRYHGPRVDLLGSADEERIAVALHYKPGETPRHFAALRFERFESDGNPIKPDTTNLASAFSVETQCEHDCLHVSLQLAAEAGPLRLPLPVNHTLVGPVEVNGKAHPVFQTAEGLPALLFKRPTRGTLTYRSTLTKTPLLDSRPSSVHGVPANVLRIVTRSRRLPPAQRLAILVGAVRDHIRYDRSSAVAARHLDAQTEGTGFLERTFAIGAGDCDIQNAVLAVLLQQTGLRSRLSAGYVGIDGQATPLAHAWAESLFPDGQWRVADASLRSEAAGAATDVVDTTDKTEMTGAEIETSASMETDPAAAIPTATTVPEAERRLPFIPLALGLVVLTGLAMAWRLRPRRAPQFALDPNSNLPALIAAALSEPHLFRRFEGLFQHHLVPTLGGADLSIDEARQLASQSRLYCATESNTLVDQKAHARHRVIDANDAIGARVARHLGAIDLDSWQRALAEFVSHPLLTRVEELFTAHDVTVRIGIADTVSTSGIIFTNGVAKLPALKSHYEMLIALDARSEWLSKLQVQFHRSPVATAFTLVDRILAVIGLPKAVASSLLAASAHDAVLSAEPVRLEDRP
jgi:Histidine kinase-, DNA gyrase B-, and HSP90-like ATPase/Transglutaminase-like superfamily